MTIRQTALVGFSAFETMTLESFFRLAGRRAPGYAINPDLNAAHVLIVNADSPTTIAGLQAKAPKAQVILIGASDHGSGWTVMARPIRLLAVLDMIEQLMAKSAVAAAAAAATPEAPAPAAAVPIAAPAPVPAAAPAKPSFTPAARAAAPPPDEPAHAPAQDTSPAATPFSAPAPNRPIFGAPAPAKPPAAVEAAGPASAPRYQPSFSRTEATPLDVEKPASNTAPPSFKASRGGLLSFANSEAPNDAVATRVQTTTAANDDDDLILVVDDSDIVLRFMQGRLQRFGYAVELANTGEEAIQMCEKRFYKFIFLDVMMPGIDGYQTCRMVKKQKHGDKGAPVVVMLSSRGGSIDKIRGTLAGADAYLTKPLLEASLIKVLADHDQQTQNNFSATRPFSGMGSMR